MTVRTRATRRWLGRVGRGSFGQEGSVWEAHAARVALGGGVGWGWGGRRTAHADDGGHAHRHTALLRAASRLGWWGRGMGVDQCFRRGFDAGSAGPEWRLVAPAGVHGRRKQTTAGMSIPLSGHKYTFE